MTSLSKVWLKHHAKDKSIYYTTFTDSKDNVVAPWLMFYILHFHIFLFLHHWFMSAAQTCWANCLKEPFDIRSWHSTKCIEAQTCILRHHGTSHSLCSFQTFCSGNLIWFTLKLRQINVTANDLNTDTATAALTIIIFEPPSMVLVAWC